jgi:hypothetical protein
MYTTDFPYQVYGEIDWDRVVSVAVDTNYVFKYRAFINAYEYYHVTDPEDLKRAMNFLKRKRDWIERDIRTIEKDLAE